MEAFAAGCHKLPTSSNNTLSFSKMAAPFTLLLRRFAPSPLGIRTVFRSAGAGRGTGRMQGLQCGRKTQVRRAHTPAEDPNWTSIVDNPAKLVRTGGKHGYGLIILGTESISETACFCFLFYSCYYYI